jgi:hypothetical protein
MSSLRLTSVVPFPVARHARRVALAVLACVLIASCETRNQLTEPVATSSESPDSLADAVPPEDLAASTTLGGSTRGSPSSRRSRR